MPGWGGFAARLGFALAALTVLLWLLGRLLPPPVGVHGIAGRVEWLAIAVGSAVFLYAGILWLLGFRVRDFVLRAS
jgi:peptidoglycan biosynthesis protein MviN/MurJ (putative lipid II flippase)